MKPPKFRKDILETTAKLGGLKMTNLQVFNNALKLSWLKRLSNPNDEWEQFPRHYNIHKIILFGDKYPTLLLQNTNNPFWRDAILACVSLYTVTEITHTKPYNTPLWFNSGINIGFKKEWFKKGYTKLNDIMDINGDLLTNNDMLLKGLKLNFLEYERLRYDITKLNIQQEKNEICGPYIPILLFKIGFNAKGCSQTYNLLMKTNKKIVIETQHKWETILNEEIPYYIIERSFKQIQKMKEGSFTKYLQFKLLHNRVVTNQKLQAMGLSDNSNCPYCESIEESTEHAF